MLTIFAFAMVATFMALIMSGRVSALAALILTPTAFALAGGFASGLGAMMLNGVRELAPTGVMLVFAILYFGLMIDAGLFDPLVKRITRAVAGDPLRITIGTVVLALIVGLDGDGSTTYMITVAAMLPLYQRLNLDVRVLACLAIMSSAVSNLLPWGGPTARAATALHLDPAALFLSLLPAILITGIWVFVVAWIFGVRERVRLRGAAPGDALIVDEEEALVPEPGLEGIEARRPSLIWINAALTLALLVALIAGALPLPILFMLAFALAMIINYPRVDDQRERLYAHAGNALSVGGLVFAAGIFTGILNGTGAVDAMAHAVTDNIPQGAGPFLAPITALVSIPFTFLISNDAFYFGMLPVLAAAGGQYGISAEEMARASLIGQQVHLLSPLVPSTYLLVGMVGIELAQHQKFTMIWAIGAAFVFLVAALAIGAFPLMARA